MKIFVLLSRFPFPLEKGDKLRAYHQIRQLSRNHEIHLCALNDIHLKDDYIKALDPYCKSIHVLNLSKLTIAWNILLAFITGKPLQVGYFYNLYTQRKIDKLIDEIKPDHIYCQLLRVAEYVRKKNIPKTLDYQDVFSKGIDRRKETSPFYMKPLLKLEYKRLCRYEKELFDDFDHKTIISFPDRAFIPHPERNEIVVVTNGVDTDYFKPFITEKKYDLIFTGNMGYPPNVNAACFLVKTILPLVHQRLPDTRLVLAGASPHTRVLTLKNDKVEVTGWVEDIREYYASAKIFIAPMQIGTGLQNKLLEAMAMKIPCITSPLANSALEAIDKEQIMIGTTPQEYAHIIIELLTNPAKADNLAEKGYEFVHRNFNWESAIKKLEALMVLK
jgi:sugar transferase (PEP-CTERM/EpsH1 system associated)